MPDTSSTRHRRRPAKGRGARREQSADQARGSGAVRRRSRIEESIVRGIEAFEFQIGVDAEFQALFALDGVGRSRHGQRGGLPARRERRGRRDHDFARGGGLP